MPVRTKDSAQNSKNAKDAKRARAGATSHASVERLEERRMLASTWGQVPQLIEQDKAASAYPGIDGRGTSIVIIDQGVSYNDAQLGGGFGPGFKVVAGYDFDSNDGNPAPTTDPHGTSVAGVAAGLTYYVNGQRYQGIAPGASIIALKASNTYADKSALDWVVANRAKYNIVGVNIVDYGGGPETTWRSDLQALNSQGVIYAMPAGNNNQYDGVTFDANLLQVGSVNQWGQVSGFTGRGPGVQFLAPGEQMMIPFEDPITGAQSIAQNVAGTSWASPQIVGTAALIKQINPNFTAQQVISILHDSGIPTWDASSGITYARLDVYNAITLAYQRSGQAAPPAVVAVATPTPAPTPTPTTAQSPFSGTAISVPGTIEAANFDNGGQGVSYNSPYNYNPGGVYRSTGVGIEATTDAGGGYGVGYTKAGQWMKYTINVPTAGTYNLSVRVSTAGTGGAFHVEVDGTSAGSVSLPNTGGWQNWQTISAGKLTLSAGQHVLKLAMDAAGTSGFAGNFNWIQLAAAPVAAPLPAPAPAATAAGPFSGTPIALPGQIEAENFDNGGQWVAYNSPFSTNPGGAYRSTGVGIEATSDAGGGYDVGWTKVGEWIDYTVKVTTAGTYNLAARVAAGSAGGSFHVEIDGAKLGSVAIPSTGGWQTWTTISAGTASLSAGQHVIRIVMDTAGSTGYVGNFNWIQVTAAPGTQAAAAAVPASAGGLASANIGNAAAQTTVVTAGRDYNITATGASLGGADDSFNFTYQALTGDFDIKVQVPFLTQAAYGTVAGLVARSSLDTNSLSTSILAGPSAGASFNYRASPGSGTITAGTRAGLSPFTWLRLKRSGGAIAGFRSSDGINWDPIGWVTLNLPTTLYVGMAVASYSPNATVAQFRAFSNV